MADFVEEVEEQNTEEVALKEPESGLSENMDPVSVVYCPKCTMPPEYCEHGPCFEQCLPWILKNCPEVLSDELLAKMTDSLDVNEEEEKPKKKNKGPKLKKSAELVAGRTQVVIAKVQRQKRKFITAVAGLDTVPGLKLKDAAKAFGKKFSSGASINENATGSKEVVIQGDVGYDLPELLINKFSVPPNCIFFLENKELVPFE
mmetsp:Transcript_17577/g.33141  ORF Transcript_17577/g.33141 Transcript_17577/m.33141 type:complete len:203 (+) Transcript_17577:42-650(+)